MRLEYNRGNWNFKCKDGILKDLKEDQRRRQISD